MSVQLAEPRVLVCGSRRWPWPQTVAAVLERLTDRYSDRLVVIEGGATGADRAAHDWCLSHVLPSDRHRCHPVDWAAQRKARPASWKLAGPERNTRMLLAEDPRLIIAFHDHFVPASGGTSDMALRGLTRDVPVWLVPGQAPDVGRWLQTGIFPTERVRRVRDELAQAASGR